MVQIETLSSEREIARMVNKSLSSKLEIFSNFSENFQAGSLNKKKKKLNLRVTDPLITRSYRRLLARSSDKFIFRVGNAYYSGAVSPSAG